MSIYEFWDVRSNNILNAFDSRDEAIEAIRRVIREDGELAVECVMPMEDDPNSDHKNLIGVGSELIAYARDAA